MAQHNDLGKEGEKIATDYLLSREYEILQTNYRHLKAEIDIIAKKENVLAVVEVKTRKTNFFGNPEEFVNQKKINLLISAIDFYILKNDLDVEVRFDIISIIKNLKETKIEHIKNAFLHF